MSFAVEKETLGLRINYLEKEVDDAKESLRLQLENLTDVVKEEKCVRKRMEQWFQRRLEAIEYYINDLKSAPGDEKKIETLLSKVKSIKTKHPWNKDKPDLFLDEALLNQKANVSEVKSYGTATPFSHYVCLFSSNVSEENTINQAFIESQDQSLSMNQNILLDTSDTEHIEKPKNDAVDNFAKQMHNKNLSLTEKEKLFCAVLENNTSNQNLLHVKLEEILQVGKSQDQIEESKGNEEQPSLSLGSFRFDKKDENIGNGCRRFNKTIKLEILRDGELEIEVSSIHMGSHRASDILDSFKQSKSINNKALGFDPSMNSRIDLDKEKNSLLDKPILSDLSLSELNMDPEAQRKRKESLQNILSFDKGSESISKFGGENDLHNKQMSEINLSNIQGKKENNNEFSKLFEKLEESNNFLVDEDDMKNFLDKAASDLDLSTSSHQKPTQKLSHLMNHELELMIDTSQIGKHSESAFISERLLEDKPIEKSHRKSKILDHEFENQHQQKVVAKEIPKKEIKHDEEEIEDLQELMDDFKDSLVESNKINENENINEKKQTYSKPKPPSGPRRSMDFRQSNPFLEDVNPNIQENSFENPKDALKPISPQLNFSMFNIVESNSFDAEIENNPRFQGKSSPEKLKLEYKNLRATRSQTPQSRSHLKLNTKLQHVFREENNFKEIREINEESPPKRNEPTNYFRSLSLQNHNQFLYKQVQPHSSYAKPRHDLLDVSSSSPNGEHGKYNYPVRPQNILPYEASRNYPAPNTHNKQEFLRKVPTQPTQPVQKAQSAKYVRSMFTGGEENITEKPSRFKRQEIKPMSPTKKSRLGLAPEESQSATFNSQQNDGMLQFRAKKFASKKV